MDTEKVIDYVMSTPHNTNRAVLKSMLDGASGGSDGMGTDSIFLINVVDSSEVPLIFDRTEEEIIEAINSNKNVKLAYSPEGGRESGIVVFLSLARVSRTRPGGTATPTGELLTEHGVDFVGEYGSNENINLVYATMTFSPLDAEFTTIPINGIK